MEQNTKSDDIQFWQKIQMEDKEIIIISKSEFIKFLENRNYRKYVESKNFQLVKIVRNSIVIPVMEHQIREEVKNHLIELQEQEVWEEFLKSDYLSKKYTESIESIEIDFDYGSEDTAVFFYKNGVLTVTKDRMFMTEYEDHHGYVWQDQILKRDFVEADYTDADFWQFCWNIAGQKEDRMLPLETVMGYCLHSYKDPALTKAVILIDEHMDVENETSEGGTGKSLIATAISKLTPTLKKNGKLLKGNDKFFFADVEPHHKVIVFDDVRIDFSFEILYSMITGDMPIEKKYKNPTVVDFKDVPKVIITSNYVVTGTGGSSEQRRKVTYEVSAYYKETPPMEEFGHRLFDDWEIKEWQKFDNYMMSCVQLFLTHGLVEAVPINIEINRLIQDTSKAFVEFMDDALKNPLNYKGETKDDLHVRFNKKELFEQFKGYEEDYVTPNSFKKYLVLYADSRKIRSKHQKSNGAAYVYFYDVLNQQTNQ